jgi:hypothetical protein
VTRALKFEPAPGGPTPMVATPTSILFFRGTRTPSAFADGFSLGYNVDGSLNTGKNAVKDTMVHELFHANDLAHGPWSPGALGAIWNAIVAKCGARTPCLTPYAPGETMVRGGTYYAFHPGNDVREYAAELAVRYFKEQEAALATAAGGTSGKGSPFKCGPPENARAWGAIVREFFAGIDRTPACGSP